MPILTITVPVNGRDMAVQTAWPAGSGPFPALVVIQHAPGLDSFLHNALERLARAGYFAAAPDIYHRLDSRLGGLEKMALLHDVEVETDVNAAVDFLRTHPLVDGARLGLTGFCMGGRVVYLMAARNPHFRAAVAWYGGNILRPWGEGVPSPFERTAEIRCPLQFHFGAEDTNPSPDDMRRLDAELARHGKPHEFYLYEGAGHAFLNFTNVERYREAAAQAAWPRMLEFFARHLAG